MQITCKALVKGARAEGGHTKQRNFKVTQDRWTREGQKDPEGDEGTRTQQKYSGDLLPSPSMKSKVGREILKDLFAFDTMLQLFEPLPENIKLSYLHFKIYLTLTKRGKRNPGKNAL